MSCSLSCAENKEYYKLPLLVFHIRFQFLLWEIDNRTMLCSFSLLYKFPCEPRGLKTWIFSDRPVPKSMCVFACSLEMHNVVMKNKGKSYGKHTRSQNIDPKTCSLCQIRSRKRYQNRRRPESPCWPALTDNRLPEPTLDCPTTCTHVTSKHEHMTSSDTSFV